MMNQLAENMPLALVTGAARRLGRAIARGLAQAGYAIGLHYYQSAADAQNTAEEIQKLGVPVQLYRADLTKVGEIQAMFDQVSSQPHSLQVLVNSAAIMKRSSLREEGVSGWDETMAINLRAPWLCAQQASRLMQANGGVIINISDSGAHKAWTGYPAYVISKAGLEALTRLQARTYAPVIRVNAVAPGLSLPPAQMSGEEWQRLVDRSPTKKAPSALDVVDAVLFLVRNESITGQTIVIDGGNQLV
jgi:NAD(P)-dependent dehydrogenase (short-subunit alcohol dehydrogenase family)